MKMSVKRENFDRRVVNESGGFAVVREEALGKVDLRFGKRRMKDLYRHSVDGKVRGE